LAVWPAVLPTTAWQTARTPGVPVAVDDDNTHSGML